ncbi:MAG: hypothetical protein ACIARR_06960 [Phycisphaerales bacterium JB059]
MADTPPSHARARTAAETFLIALLIAFKTFTASHANAQSCSDALPDAGAWDFQIQCRSSLEASIPPFNLPFPSSLSSQYVSLDQDGAVAIRYFSSGSHTEGVFYGLNGSGGPIIQVTSVDPTYSTDLDLNAGMLAIADASFGAGGAHVFDSTRLLLPDFPPGGPQALAAFSSPTMLADGAIAYRADFGSADVIAIDEFDGPTRTQTVLASTLSDYTFLLTPTANDNRQVVANTLPVSGPSRRIIRFEPDGSPTTVAETGATFTAFVNSTTIASNGFVAFTARRAADSIWAVYLWDGATLTEIAAGDNPDIDNSSLANFPPVFNARGWVAFRATDVENDSTALWVGDGNALVKLVEYDQLLPADLGDLPAGFDFGGLTGKQTINGVIDINDAGQVAFANFFQNGTIGVYVATPALVAGCNPTDLAEPCGVLDFSDVVEFLTFFSNGCP